MECLNWTIYRYSRSWDSKSPQHLTKVAKIHMVLIDLEHHHDVYRMHVASSEGAAKSAGRDWPCGRTRPSPRIHRSRFFAVCYSRSIRVFQVGHIPTCMSLHHPLINPSSFRRWQPVLPLGLPHQSLADDVYNGFLIPAGSLVVGNTW